MIFVKSAKDLSFIRFNKAGEQLLGFSRQEMFGKSDFDFFPPREADFFTKIDKDVLLSRKSLEIPEEKIHTKNRGIRILHTIKVPLYSANGEALYLFGISEDITEKKKLEQDRILFLQERAARIEVEKAIANRDEFIGIASHELKTPITTLSLQCEFISSILFSGKKIEIEKLNKAFERTKAQIQALTSLIDNMLSISQISGGKFLIAKKWTNLTKALQGLLDKLERDSKSVGITMTSTIEDNLFADVDIQKIEVIINNLVSNAQKYGNRKPFSLEIKGDGPFFRIQVTDHGVGINQEDQKKIFQKFERIETSGKTRGFGLGLYIVSQYTIAHQGEVSIISQVGKGSSFSVKIPKGTPINK